MSLLNPSIPIPVDAIEVDAAIIDLDYKLITNLSWLSAGYGRAFSHLELKGGKKLYYPEVYAGTKKNAGTVGQAQYFRVTFDNKQKGMFFFVVGKEQDNRFVENQYNKLTFDIGIIFQTNLNTINNSLLDTTLFTQNLIADVRQILTRQIHEEYSLSVTEVVRSFKEVYKEFTLEEKEGYNIAPHQIFRFNCKLVVKEFCGVVLNRSQAILNNLSLDEILTLILPNIDFSDPNAVAALTAQQKIDLGI